MGSFLNVVALRYRSDRFLFSPSVIGGRSHCPRCGHKLAFGELVPFLSFILQRGRCRACRERISIRYPLVEFLAGLLMVAVPFRLAAFHIADPVLFFSLAALWAGVFFFLLLAALIDMRLQMIPDEANIAIGILGIGIALIEAHLIGAGAAVYPTFSFLGSYALLWNFGGVLLEHAVAGIAGGAFFLGLFFITRGRGMGMGDAKLALALGLAFSSPDIVLIIGLSFIIGAAFGVGAMVFGKKGMKSLLPFGPFLALAALLVFLFGYEILKGYFGLFGVF